MFKYCLIVVGLLLWGCSYDNVIGKEYYSNGRLESEKQFKDGKLNGESKEYSNGGRLIAESHWINGVKDTVEYHSQDGETIKVIYKANGKMGKVYYKMDTGSFSQLIEDMALAKAYSQQDTLTIGDTLEANLYLFKANQDSVHDCELSIGVFDTVKYRLDSVSNRMRVPQNLFIKYKVAASRVGMQKLAGIFKCNCPDGVIRQYPFILHYYVKGKQ